MFEVVFHLKKIVVVFHLIFFEVVFHISSRFVKIRLHTENQLLRLLWSDLKCNDTRVVWFFLPIIIPPQQKLFWVVLGCWLGCGNSPYFGGHFQIIASTFITLYLLRFLTTLSFIFSLILERIYNEKMIHPLCVVPHLDIQPCLSQTGHCTIFWHV